MTTQVIPQFNVKVGENIFGPITTNKVWSSAVIDFDIGNMNAPFWIYIEWAEQGVETWHVLAYQDVTAAGFNKDGTPNTRCRFGFGYPDSVLRSGIRLRARMESDGAWASSGGTLDWV